jgi:formate dehydrogenase iron-sulfur subunit
MHNGGMNNMKEKDISRENSQSGMSRREFVGAVGAGIGAICILGAPGVVEAAEEPGTRIRAILYDSTKCIGCHTCEKACKIANKLPWDVVTGKSSSEETATTTGTETLTGAASTTSSMTTTSETTDIVSTTTMAEDIAVNDDLDADSWVNVKVWEKKSADDTKEYLYVRQACMHCGSCARVCPSKALVQREDGIVTMNPAKCIGCHYCHAACPFDIPRYGKDGAMRKCIMCYGLVDEGKKPACVEACPTNALTFGYRDELVKDGKEQVSELVADGNSAAYLYGEKELGGTPLMYVLPYSCGVYGLPKLPLESQKPVTWKDFIIPGGIVVGLAALAFGGITYIKNRGGKAVKEETSKDK